MSCALESLALAVLFPLTQAVQICIYYLILRALDTVEDDMTIPIEKKAPMLENFHEYLEIDGWTFQECTD